LREASILADEASGEVGRRRQSLADCAGAKEASEKKKTERGGLLKEKQVYSDLASAFGRAGVQALIIDNVLPEIQDEANRLLGRMTDNAMKVTLTTLREARSRSGQIETLDISITDDAGTRPYEMYSGGEAFRVNFAIRIALSRLLARRAGAKLQTLIIDEGFGTQDAKGRERLVEAIQSVQDEFDLILVITHVEELKDAFPSRIDILKTPEGSQVLQAE
jgi:exonuclease SbcC